MNPSVVIAAAIGFLAASWAPAQCQLGKMSPPDGDDAILYFGHSVSIDDDRAVAGAPEDSPSGTVDVWRFDRDTWVQEATLRATHGARVSTNFGFCVSIDQPRIAVGAWSYTECWGDVDHDAFIKTSDYSLVEHDLGCVAEPCGKPCPGDADEDGDTDHDDLALVTAHLGEFCAQDGGGGVYVFRREGCDYVCETLLLPPAGAGPFQEFGWSVCLAGDRLVVGAPGNGEAYVYRRDGRSWTLEATLKPQDGAMIGGLSALSENWIALSYGPAYLFRRDDHGTPDQSDDTWVEHAKLIPSSGGGFGGQMSFSGDYLALGAPFHDSRGVNESGAVFIYHRDDRGTADLIDDVWIEQAILSTELPLQFGWFGQSVSFDGPRLIAGRYFYSFSFDDGGTPSDPSDDVWKQNSTLYFPPGSTGIEDFGLALALDGTTAVVGAPATAGRSTGSAYIYDLVGANCCLGDITGDHKTDQSDLGVMLAAYETCPDDPGYDYSAGILFTGGPQGYCVDQSDLGVLLADYGCVPAQRPRP